MVDSRAWSVSESLFQILAFQSFPAAALGCDGSGLLLYLVHLRCLQFMR
jgi:hypothetical protein